jgi:hypothetical protein
MAVNELFTDWSISILVKRSIPQLHHHRFCGELFFFSVYYNNMQLTLDRIVFLVFLKNLSLYVLVFCHVFISLAPVS